MNTFESKVEAQNHVIKLKASDFKWLIAEYRKRQHGRDSNNNNQTFERFADEFLKELLDRVSEAKKILNTWDCNRSITSSKNFTLSKIKIISY